MHRPAAWSPLGFERHREIFPATPEIDPALYREASARFLDLWDQGADAAQGRLRPHAAATTVVFVRGFLGHYMHGNLAAPCLALRRLGFDAMLADNRPGACVAENVARIENGLRSRNLRGRIVFCGHSRGGMDSLLLLARRPSWAERCAGIILSQTARGPSYVMESVLFGRHRGNRFPWRRRLAEATQRAGLHLIGAAEGGRELTSDHWPALADEAETAAYPFPVLHSASWSTRPTAWLDSFHARLGQIGPGLAHDGQFFLKDLIWPGRNHVLLPHLDHAQPAVGGFGFDHARYWLTLLALMRE